MKYLAFRAGSPLGHMYFKSAHTISFPLILDSILLWGEEVGVFGEGGDVVDSPDFLASCVATFGGGVDKLRVWILSKF